MADVAIKPEIKVDPADSDVKLGDVEEFEEDTDLQFPAPDAKAWFARIPSELWQAWHQIYVNAPDNAQIEVGKMRVYNSEKEIVDDREQKIEIHLQSSISQTQKLPQKYALKIQTVGSNNTVVFSEKDLPGHSSRAFGRGRYNNNRSSGVNKNERYGKKTGYASAIPKQTALAPPIQHEAIVSPEVDSASFFQGLVDAMKVPASNRTTFQLGSDSRNLQQNRNSNAFSSFTTSSKPLKGKKKVPKEKAVRMDQEQLYDAVYKCFGRYRYWRLSAFRKELHQPEAFIKSTLDRVANLVRTGDFAGCYVLKPEYVHMMSIDQSQVKEESANIESAAEDGTDGGTGDELDDDDIVEMEDVKMENS